MAHNVCFLKGTQGRRRVFKSGPAEEAREGDSTRGGLFSLS